MAAWANPLGCAYGGLNCFPPCSNIRSPGTLGQYLDRLALLAEPFRNHVATEREARDVETVDRAPASEFSHHKLEIGCLTGMVEPPGAIHTTATRPEIERRRRPAERLEAVPQTQNVVRLMAALETM